MTTVAESFLSALKRERIRRRIYKTRKEARPDVFDYIEMFYDPVRKHDWDESFRINLPLVRD